MKRKILENQPYTSTTLNVGINVSSKILALCLNIGFICINTFDFFRSGLNRSICMKNLFCHTKVQFVEMRLTQLTQIVKFIS